MKEVDRLRAVRKMKESEERARKQVCKFNLHYVNNKLNTCSEKKLLLNVIIMFFFLTGRRAESIGGNGESQDDGNKMLMNKG